jgi:hypothetical protein
LEERRVLEHTQQSRLDIDRNRPERLNGRLEVDLFWFQLKGECPIQNVPNDGPCGEQLLIERVSIIVEPALDDEVIVLEIREVLNRLTGPPRRDVPTLVRDAERMVYFMKTYDLPTSTTRL